MDFLLILLTIGGLVASSVMLVLAFRAARMERESDARVQTLQSMAIGSVLFASDAFTEFADEATGSQSDLRSEEPLAVTPASSFGMPANTYPFVMSVPVGTDRILGSFDRTEQRSRT